MYYRVAIQSGQSSTWQWKSTPLSSLHALVQWLHSYRAFPHDRLRIFSSSLREAMHEQLVQENQGLGSNSVTANQFLHERRLRSSKVSGRTAELARQEHQQMASIAVSTEAQLSENSRAISTLVEMSRSSQERRRLEFELGAGADHDVAYSFTLPPSMLQILAWLRLLARIQRGEVQP